LRVSSGPCAGNSTGIRRQLSNGRWQMSADTTQPRLLVTAAGDEVPAAELDKVAVAAGRMWPAARITVLHGRPPWTAAAPDQWEWITRLQSEEFDQCVIVGDGVSSPYPLAYACYLAGIPFRSGVTSEFGGKLLTRRVDPAGPGRYPAPEDLIEKPHEKGS
jgi:hypothetical protein